jgi:AAA ATPase domain
VLVVSGEAGIGKTALLESAIGSASGFRVVRAVGVESEMELAFAALQQLCAADAASPGPASWPTPGCAPRGVRATCGKRARSVSRGVGGAEPVSEVAEEQPLVCVVDDAQWVDRVSAQALAFVARRLLAGSVALVFATREAGEELTGLPGLVVEGLGNGDARALLGSALRVPLDERVRERIVAETRGNPLALLELPRGLTPAQLAGGFGVPRRAGAVGAHRGQLPPQACGAPGADPAAVVGRGGGAGRRPGAGVARGRAAGDRSPGGGRDRRVARDRRVGDFSSPVGPLVRV